MRYQFPPTDTDSPQARANALDKNLLYRREGRYFTSDGWFEIRRAPGTRMWHVSLTGTGKKQAEALRIRARMHRVACQSRQEAFTLLHLASIEPPPPAPSTSPLAASLAIASAS